MMHYHAILTEEIISERNSVQRINSYLKKILEIAPLISISMESIFLKIPDLGEKIFKEIDNQSLVKCKEVQRSWYNFINEEKVLWFRMIQNYIGDDNEFLTAWRKVLWKVPVAFVTQIAIVTQKVNAIHQIQSDDSPIHVAASDGSVDLYKQIMVKLADMNPNHSK